MASSGCSGRGALRAHLAAAGLARQKWPEEIHRVDDFPRTASGKVRKYVLRAEVAACSKLRI